ncbi:MAG: NADH-quinone oxidoreductase subunit NuoF [Acidimicrobiia bacterium]
MTSLDVDHAEGLIDRYPERRSAVLPLLYLAMKRDGHIGDEAMRWVAGKVGLTPAQVHSVASFYTMFKQEPVGRYLVSVCTSISCMLEGSDDVLEAIEDETGVPAGETDSSGLLSVEHVECIGACGGAPALQVNYELVEGINPEKARALGRWLRDAQPDVVGTDEMQELFGGRRSYDWGSRESVGAVGPYPAFGPYGTGGKTAASEPSTPATEDLAQGRTGLSKADATPLILTQRMEDHPADSHLLERYEATGGYRALRKALDVEPSDITEQVKASELRGRGGAGFSCGMKWSFLGQARPAYLIVNADESEPGTFKDRQLLERDPHQMLEGTIIASFANDVNEAFVYVRGEYAKPARRVQQAVEDAYGAGYLGKNILGSGYDLDVTVHLGAGAYICGEETALLNSLEGRRGEPRLKPPYYPAAMGLYDLPTIVNNVETLSNIPFIISEGSASYSSLGPEGSKGTRLFSLSGAVERPGNFEIVMGMTWRELIYAIGGGIPGGKELKTWVPGGASAPWLGPEHLDTPVAIDEVGELGTMLGSGAVIVMDSETCTVRAAERIVRFFAHESCGQCTPCREGATWLEMVLRRIEEGSGREQDIDLILDVSDNISPGLDWPPKMTTICPLGPSAVSPITSLVSFFKDELLDHIHGGGCPFD